MPIGETFYRMEVILEYFSKFTMRRLLELLKEVQKVSGCWELKDLLSALCCHLVLSRREVVTM